MDLQAIIDRVTGALGGAPERIGEFTANPQSFIEEVVGALPEGISDSEVANGVQERLSSLDFTGYDLSSIADGGLGQLLDADLPGTAEAASAAAGDVAASATDAASGLASSLGLDDGVRIGDFADAVDFSAVSDALPDGIGDAVSGVVGGSSEGEGGLAGVVSGILGGLFGKR